MHQHTLVTIVKKLALVSIVYYIKNKATQKAFPSFILELESSIVVFSTSNKHHRKQMLSGVSNISV